MDKKFLNKVVDQIVRETRIDYDMGEIQFPFSPYPFPTLNPSYSPSFPPYFPLSFYSEYSNHCRDVYGLNNEESKYVWEEYKRIIKDKIDSNG